MGEDGRGGLHLASLLYLPPPPVLSLILLPLPLPLTPRPPSLLPLRPPSHTPKRGWHRVGGALLGCGDDIVSEH